MNFHVDIETKELVKSTELKKDHRQEQKSPKQCTVLKINNAMAKLHVLKFKHSERLFNLVTNIELDH